MDKMPLIQYLLEIKVIKMKYYQQIENVITI